MPRAYRDRREYYAEWLKKNHARKLAYMRAYRKANLKKTKAACRKWAKENPDKVRANHLKYYAENKQELQKYRAAWARRERERSENFRIRCRLRTRIACALKSTGTRKCAKTMELIGCDMEFLRGWIESQFEDGMTWENIGFWHLDHYVPCAEFDLRDPAQQKQCFSYKNLRPLWAIDNMRKGAKRPSEIAPHE